MLEAKDSFEQIGKKDLFSSPLSRGSLAFEWYALSRENKNYSGVVSDKIITYRLEMDRLNPVPLTLSEIMTMQKRYPTTIPLNVGESSVVFAKKRFIDMALTRHHQLLSEPVDFITELMDLMLSADERENFIRKNLQHSKTLGLESLAKEILLLKRIKKDFKSKAPIDKVTEVQHKYKLMEEIMSVAENLLDREKVWLTADVTEDDEGNVIRTIKYHLKYLGQDIVYDDIYKFVNDFMQLKNITSAREQLIFLSALRLRTLYDINVPIFVKIMTSYIDKSINVLLTISGQNRKEATEGLVALTTMRKKYLSYEAAINKRTGNYVPHSYPIEEFKASWRSVYYEIIRNNLLRKVAVHKERKAQIDDAERPIWYSARYADMDETKINTEVIERLEKLWRRFKIGAMGTTFIPNFMERHLDEKKLKLRYDVYTMSPHQTYITNLIKAFKSDIMKAMYYEYIEKARLTGEKENVIAATKRWFGDQIDDKVMHTKPTKISKLQPGMEINFTLPGELIMNGDIEGAGDTLTFEEVQIWGIVKKITKDKIYLEVDNDSLELELAHLAENVTDYDEVDPEIFGGDANKISEKQVAFISYLIKRGLISLPGPNTNISTFTTAQASKFINSALKEAFKKGASEIGVYKIDEIFIRDLQGNKIKNSVNRHFRSGLVEGPVSKAREADNRRLMGEGNETAYHFYKTLGGFSRVMLKILTPLRATMFIGGFVSGKAFSSNWMGGLISKVIDAPISTLGPKKGLIRAGMDEWARIKHGRTEIMSSQDKRLFALLDSLNLTNKKSVMMISLENIGVNLEDSGLKDKGLINYIKELITAFRDSSKYKEYVKRLSALDKELIMVSSEKNEEKLTKVLAKIAKLKNEWRAIVNGLMTEFSDQDTSEDIAFNKLSGLTRSQEIINIAEVRGLTRSEIIKKLLLVLPDDLLFKGWLGVKIQGIAEYMRRPTFFIGYLRALSMGYDEKQASIYGLNNVWYRDAFYGKSNRQFGANSDAGKLLYQFSQYIVNAVMHLVANTKQAYIQSLGKIPLKDREAKIHTISGIYTALEQNLKIKDQQDRLQDFDIKRAMVIKAILSLIIMQLGSRVFWGLNSMIPPEYQIFYHLIDGLVALVMKMLDEEENKELANDILFLVEDLLFFLGAGHKTAMNIAIKGPKEGLFGGRPEEQVRNSAKLFNTAYYIATNGKYITEDYNKIMTEDDLDKFFLNLEIWGYTNPLDEEVEVNDDNFIWGTRLRKIRASTRPFEKILEEGEGIGFKQRLRMLAQPQSYIPVLDRF